MSYLVTPKQLQSIEAFYFSLSEDPNAREELDKFLDDGEHCDPDGSVINIETINKGSYDLQDGDWILKFPLGFEVLTKQEFYFKYNIQQKS